MTLNQLRAFLCAARLGSFTAAATELRMAQASVSELVRRLEEELGLALFERGPRRLTLSSAGAELLPFADSSLSTLEEGRQAVASIGTLSGGTISFGLLRNWAYYGLSDLPVVFRKKYPGVCLRLVGLSSTEVASSVASGDLEAGFVVLPIDDEGLTVRPIIRDELLYASSSRERTAEPMTIARLAAADLTMYDARTGWLAPTRRNLAERAQREGFKLHPIVEVEHVEAALRVVAQGVGDTVLPRAIAMSDALPPHVFTVPFSEPIYDTIAFIHRPSSRLSAGARERYLTARAMITAGAAPGDHIELPATPSTLMKSEHADRERIE